MGLPKKNKKIANLFMHFKVVKQHFFVTNSFTAVFQLTVCCLKLYFPKVTSDEKKRKSGSYLLLKCILHHKAFKIPLKRTTPPNKKNNVHIRNGIS